MASSGRWGRRVSLTRVLNQVTRRVPATEQMQDLDSLLEPKPVWRPFCPSSLRAQLNSRQKDKPTRNMGLEGDHPSSPGAVPAASAPPPRAVASSDQVQAGQTADAHHRPSGLTAGTREAAAGRLRKSECRRGTLCNRAPRSQTTRGTHRGIFVVQRIAGFYSQEPLAP